MTNLNLPAQTTPTGVVEAIPAPTAVGPALRYSPEPDVDDEPKVDVRRYIAAIIRHKWLVGGLTVVGTVAGFFVAKMQKPQYAAQSTIWIELAGSNSSGPIQQGQLVQNTNWVDLLTSFTVMDSVVKEQRLFVWAQDVADTGVVRSLNILDRFRPGNYELKIDAPGRRWTLSTRGGAPMPILSGNVGDSIGADLGFLWQPPAHLLKPGRTIDFGLVTPRQSALEIVARLTTKIPLRDGNFLRMELKGGDPVRLASTLNAIGQQFVYVAAELKKDKLKQLSQILEGQLDSSEATLHRAERALEVFRVNTITEPTDAQSPPVASGLTMTQSAAMADYFKMKTNADQLGQDRAAIQRVLALGDSAITPVALEPIQSVKNNPGLSQALSDLLTKQVALRVTLGRYTSDNPNVLKAMREIQDLQRETIPTLLRSLLEELRVQERLLSGRIASTERDLREIPTRTITEARLRRDVAIADQLYTSLEGRFSNAKLAEASSIPDVRVLDPAVVPDSPLTNLKFAIFGGGIALGFGVGIGLALLLDKFDRRLRYPDQVASLGLTILGTVPRVTSNGKGPRNTDGAQVVESLRSIRLNLVNAYGAAGPLVTTITSPGSGDGKSFLASNLALAFADAGHRTLLIDGDIRRGTLHRVLNVNRKPGLLDFLGGQATREQVIQATRVPSVDFIGCGTRKMGGPELLASPAMSQLILSLRSQYNVIIVDSAPLGAGVDALVLGTLTGSLLLVLRTGVTDTELASAKLGDLDRLPIRVLGAVLNDVKAEGIYKYYSYLPGYSSDDETAAEDAKDRAAISAGKAGR
jgi:capsular exopolysaccharide synthesis family protein